MKLYYSNYQKFIYIVLVIWAILLFYNLYVTNKTHHLTILHTNDIGTKIFEYNENKQSNAELLASLINRTKNENKNVLLLDAGNFTPSSYYSKHIDGRTIAKLMSIMGYDAALLGNHELDRGINYLEEMTDQPHLPLLCENVHFPKHEKLNNRVDDYIIKNFNGLKVGIIGIIGNGMITQYINSNEIKISNTNEKERLAKLIQKIKPKVDLVVVLSNNLFDKNAEIALNVPGIDVMIGGWSNHKLEPIKYKNTIYLQSNTNYLGKLDLSIKNKKVQNYRYVSEIISKNKEDKTISNKIKSIIKLNNYNQTNVIGTLVNEIDPTYDVVNNNLSNAGALITESIRDRWKDLDIAVINSGAIKSGKIIKAGPINREDIYSFYPFKSTVVISKLSGQEIKSLLERHACLPYEPQILAFLQSSGFEYTIDLSKPKQKMSDAGDKILQEGKRVSNIKINGKPLQMNKYYKIATNDYVFGGGDGYIQFAKAKDVIKTGIDIQEIMIDYVKNNSPVKILPKDKITFLNRKNDDYKLFKTK